MTSTTVSGDPLGERIRLDLMRLGAALFLLGLLTGVASAFMASPRLGLSAHLEGVMNGTFLLAVGAIWPQVRLTDKPTHLVFWCLAIGTSLNWLTVTLAGVWGAGAGMMPLATGGVAGAPWQEAFITIALIIVTLTMIIGTATLLIGLMNKR